MRQLRRTFGKYQTHILAHSPRPELQPTARDLIEDGCLDTAVGQRIDEADHQLHPQLKNAAGLVIEGLVAVRVDFLCDQIDEVERELFRCEKLLAQKAEQGFVQTRVELLAAVQIFQEANGLGDLVSRNIHD